MEGKVCVAISNEIIYEVFIRRGPNIDLTDFIEGVISDYLAKTENDDGWKDEYYSFIKNRKIDSDFMLKFGDPSKGYQWKELYLPNGTQLYMEYQKKKHYALVKFENIHYDDETFSPSELARTIARGTIRNAWRDIYIQMPGENSWTLADVLRRGEARKRTIVCSQTRRK